MRNGSRRAPDWSDIRRRLGDMFASTEQRSAPEVQSILENRARALARPAGRSEIFDRFEMVTFALAHDRYAIESKYVVEVGKLTDYTVVPRAPRHLLGVTNLRGDILPVFDLGLLLGHSGPGLTDRSRLLVLGDGRADLAVVADMAEDVVFLGHAQILGPADSFLGTALLAGVTAEGLIVLDGAAVLSDRRMFIEARDEPETERPVRDL